MTAGEPLHRAALALARWYDPHWGFCECGQCGPPPATKLAGEVIADVLLEQGWRVEELDHDGAYAKALSRWDKFWNRHGRPGDLDLMFAKALNHPVTADQWRYMPRTSGTWIAHANGVHAQYGWARQLADEGF